MVNFSEPQRIVERLAFIDRIVVPVWLALTGLMIASYLVLGGGSWARWAVLVMLFVTWTHPLYSQFIGPLAATLIAAAVFVVVVVVVFGQSMTAGWLLLPTIPWIAAATVYTAARTQLGRTQGSSD